ncbi:MAG: hypothetical protein ACYC6W_11495 [Nitrosotalea sp.]
MKTILIFLAIILVAIPSIVFAQSAAQITILTNKQSYVTGDTISISGTISSLGASNSAVLQVYNTFNVLVQIGTINVASDGTFHDTIKAEGQSWGNDGLYQIKVLYVSTPILATATADINFKVNPSPPTTSPPTTQPTSQTQTSTQNTTQTVPSDNQIPVEQQIQQRIALANKLKQQLDQSNQTQIPFWVKDNARKWHDGTITNAEFSKDIQYFIARGLVTTNKQIKPTGTFEHIPSWQKEVAGWWSQGIVSDYDYVNSIQFLLDEKIIS